jgi:hypothetical protein
MLAPKRARHTPASAPAASKLAARKPAPKLARASTVKPKLARPSTVKPKLTRASTKPKLARASAKPKLARVKPKMARASAAKPKLAVKPKLPAVAPVRALQSTPPSRPWDEPAEVSRLTRKSKHAKRCASCDCAISSSHAHRVCGGRKTADLVIMDKWKPQQQQHWLCSECAENCIKDAANPTIISRAGSNMAALCPFCPRLREPREFNDAFTRYKGTPLLETLADGLAGVSAATRGHFLRRVREARAHTRTSMAVRCAACDELCVAPRAQGERATAIRCIACGEATCSVCRGAHHPDETCKGKAAMAGAAAGAGVRQCHRCGLPFKHYRGEGCHQVECTCGAITCAVCGASGDNGDIDDCECNVSCTFFTCTVCPSPEAK